MNFEALLVPKSHPALIGKTSVVGMLSKNFIPAGQVIEACVLRKIEPPAPGSAVEAHTLFNGKDYFLVLGHFYNYRRAENSTYVNANVTMDENLAYVTAGKDLIQGEEIFL